MNESSPLYWWRIGKTSAEVEAEKHLADVMRRLLASRLFSIDSEANRTLGTEQTELRDSMVEALAQWEASKQ